MNGQAGDRRELFLREPRRLAKSLQLRPKRSRSAKLHAPSFYCDTSQALSEFCGYERSFQLLYEPTRLRLTRDTSDRTITARRDREGTSLDQSIRALFLSGGQYDLSAAPHHCT